MALSKLRKRKEVAVVVDSNYLCHSARHSQNLAGLSVDGIKTGIVFGFFRSVMSIYRTIGTPYFIFIWDSGVSYRKEKDPEYKANRVKFDESMSREEIEEAQAVYGQFNLLRDEIMPKLGFPTFVESGFEGDDLIASVVMNPHPDFRYVMAATDHDLYQLLDYAVQYNPKMRTYYTSQDFRREWGINPADWARVKAMAGCASDNVKGLPRVGEKTAAKFIRGEVTKGCAYKNIVSPFAKGVVEKNLKLVQLPLEGTPTLRVNPAKYTPDLSYFQDMCELYGLNSFLSPRGFGQWRDLFKLEKPE